VYISPFPVPRATTRKQSQARTRARLLDAAARVASRDGLDGSSIERVAEEAGHTRGAFYAHFDSREQLYLAMLERWFEDYLAGFDRALAGEDAPHVRARRAGDQFTMLADSDPEGQRLFFEFAVYALRNEAFRRELTRRLVHLRGRVADVFRTRGEEHGVTSPIPLERLTLITFAITMGFALDRLLEPDAAAPELHGEALSIFFAGLATLD
jgi:AcrR family transcriptional regulator